MARIIDHIVIAVQDLAQASADYASAGFTVTPGGEHTGGATHNALISFEDGAYFELIAFKRRDETHRWWGQMALGEGLVDFALGIDDLPAEADRLKAAGIAADGPRDGGRIRPDGQQIAWKTLGLPRPLPFEIEDVTARELRVPGGAATRHPLGISRVAGITLAVANLAECAPTFAILLGTNGAASDSGIAGARAARRFPLGNQWIELVQPDESDSDLRAQIEKRGDGPYQVALGDATRLLPTTTTHAARILV